MWDKGSREQASAVGMKGECYEADDDKDMGDLLPIHCKDYSGLTTDDRREQAIQMLGEIEIVR